MLGTLTVGSCGCLSSFLGWDGATVLFLLLYFCFEILAFFVYFSSPSFSYSGLMFSCFYSIAALRPFEDLKTREHFTASGRLQPGVERADLKAEFQNILSQLLAIVIATLVDLLADTSFSIRATASLRSFIQLVDEAFERYPVSTPSTATWTSEGGPGFPPHCCGGWSRGGPWTAVFGRSLAAGVVVPCDEGVPWNLAILDHCEHHR